MTNYFENELDLFCDNGVSFGVFHGDDMVGAGFNLVVEKHSQNRDYVCAKGELCQVWSKPVLPTFNLS